MGWTVYILEGNIGAGKSTFLRLIAKHIPYLQIALEPLEVWQHSIHGESILENFYHNPKRWAYSFELSTMMSRIRYHATQQAAANPFRILERSIYSGHYCFAMNSFKQNYMSALEWEIYNQWFNFLVPATCRAPFGFIYLRVEPETALARIKKRQRPGEESFELAYLKQIHERHEAFLIHMDGILSEIRQVPILVLTCDDEFEYNSITFKKHMKAIEQFILQTAPSTCIVEQVTRNGAKKLCF